MLRKYCIGFHQRGEGWAQLWYLFIMKSPKTTRRRGCETRFSISAQSIPNPGSKNPHFNKSALLHLSLVLIQFTPGTVPIHAIGKGKGVFSSQCVLNVHHNPSTWQSRPIVSIHVHSTEAFIRHKSCAEQARGRDNISKDQKTLPTQFQPPEGEYFYINPYGGIEDDFELMVLLI